MRELKYNNLPIQMRLMGEMQMVMAVVEDVVEGENPPHSACHIFPRQLVTHSRLMHT